MKTYYSAVELAEMKLPGLPTTDRNIRLLADRAGWDCVSVPSRGRAGTRREYAVSSLPAKARQTLLDRAVQLPVPLAPQLPVSEHVQLATADEDLSEADRAQGVAARMLVARIEQMSDQGGCSIRAACKTLLINAQTGLIEDSLVQSLRLARDGRGRLSPDGLPCLRSLERWVARQRAGQSLTPKKRQADMSVKPWHALAVSLRQRPQGSTLRWVHSQIAGQWRGEWGDAPPSYDAVARFFREKFSRYDVLVGRHTGMDLQAHRRYIRRSRAGLTPAMEAHADGWCTHFTAPHPISGEFVTYEVWTAIDYATGYPADPAIGMTEGYEVIAKCIENYIRTFGVPLIVQTDNTGSVKNDRFEFDPIGSLQARLGITVVHPKMLATGKGNSQANGLAENLHAFYDREARELATYQGKGMDSLTLRRVKKLTARMTRAAASGDAIARAAARREAEGLGKGIVFDSYEEACAWMLRAVEKRRDMPNRNLPKIADPATGRRRSMTPREALAQAVKDGWQPVALSDAELVDAFRPHVRKTVRRGGVTAFARQRYDHAELEHHNGEEVMVAIDIMDWRRVWVKDLDGRLICEADYLEGCSPRPQSLYEAATEKRSRAQVRRRENQIAAIESRSPVEVIEMAPRRDVALELYGDVIDAETAAPKYTDMRDVAMYLYGDVIDTEDAEDSEKEKAAR